MKGDKSRCDNDQISKSEISLLLRHSELSAPPPTPRGVLPYISYVRVLECSVCESALFSMQHGSFELSHSQTRVLHNL